MPVQQFFVAFGSPIKFSPVDYSGLPNFDYSLFRETVPYYMPLPNPVQIWHPSDAIRIQVLSQFSPVTIDRYNCRGWKEQTYASVQVPSTATLPGWAVYEFNFSPPDTTEQFYFVLNVGVAETLNQMISEPQRIINRNDTSIIFKYKDSRNRHGVIFSTGIEFQYRCYGGFGLIQPKAQMSEFTDQRLNLTTTYGIAYREFPLIIGSPYGSPGWEIDKVNRILCMDTVTINDKGYTRPAGSEWEERTVDRWPMAGYSITVREKYNQLGITVEDNNVLAERFAVLYNINTRGFGYLNILSPELRITKYE